MNVVIWILGTNNHTSWSLLMFKNAQNLIMHLLQIFNFAQLLISMFSIIYTKWIMQLLQKCNVCIELKSKNDDPKQKSKQESHIFNCCKWLVWILAPQNECRSNLSTRAILRFQKSCIEGTVTWTSHFSNMIDVWISLAANSYPIPSQPRRVCQSNKTSSWRRPISNYICYLKLTSMFRQSSLSNCQLC